MHFRYFDPLEQSVVEGDIVAGAEVAALVDRVAELRVSCSPALEFAGPDGSSLVLGVTGDRAVVLWTTADGTTTHSIGSAQGDGAMFDWFGACTQMPGYYAVPLRTAVDAAGGFVDGYPGRIAAPALPPVRD